MARAIDTSKPLSEDDRQYLISRCMWGKLAEADKVAAEQAAATAVEGNTTEQVNLPPTHVLGPQATTPTAQAPAGGDEEAPYTEWTYSELQEELKVRRQEAIDGGMNEDEAKKLYSAGGSQADLIARLEEDDARNSSQS